MCTIIQLSPSGLVLYVQKEVTSKQMANSTCFMVLYITTCLLLGCHGNPFSYKQLQQVKEIKKQWQEKFTNFTQQIDNMRFDRFGLSTPCQADMRTLLRELFDPNSTGWGWIMVDSWGLPEPGISNHIWEGRVTQCRQVRSGITGSDGTEIKGRYCILEWPMFFTWQIPTGVGTCMPTGCTKDDLYDIIRMYTDLNLIEVPSFFHFYNETDMLRNCADIPDFTKDNGAIAAVAVLCLFAFLGVFASVYDVLTEKSRDKSLIRVNMTKETVNSCNAAPSAVHEVTFQNRGFAPSSCESSVIVTGFRMRSHHEDEDLTPSSDDKMANEGTTVHLTPTSSQMAPQVTTENRTEEPNICVSLLLCFSVYRHMRNLATFKHAPTSFRCLNAIRFLSMSWIILGHSWQLGIYLTETPTADNVNDVFEKYMPRVSHEVINNMNLAVETFFVVSAMLTTLSFLKQVKKHKGKPPCSMFGLYFFHRYWRLTPVYMLVLMFYATIFPYLGTGPFYPMPSHDAQGCRTVWWLHLVYLNNMISLEDYCMGWTWYLACDFQYYVIAPAFLSLLYWFPVAGIVMTTLAICGNLVGVIYTNHGIYIRQDMTFWGNFYVAPWTRYGPYFVGIFLGYVLFKYGYKPKMNKIGVAFGWIISVAGISTSVYLSHSYTYASGQWPMEAVVAFLSLQRLVFAVGVAWIIYACCTGYGGIINSILSWVGWVPLAKLSYTGYLVHPIIIYFTYYVSPVQIHVTDWIMIYYFLGNILLTLGACFFVSSFLEIPFLHLEKVMFRNVKK